MIIHTMPQGSYEWHEIRLGKVTSTTLKSVLAGKADQMKVIDRLIAEAVSGQSDEDFYISKDMQWGIDTEPIARAEYVFLTGRSTQQVGFLQSDIWPLLGVSADSLIGLFGAAEFKCPKTKTHVQYIRENVIPKEYTYQVLDYFIVHQKLQWLDFVSYDPRFRVQPLFIKRVTRAELQQDIMDAEVKLNAFFQEFERVRSLIVSEPVKYEPLYIVEPVKK